LLLPFSLLLLVGCSQRADAPPAAPTDHSRTVQEETAAEPAEVEASGSSTIAPEAVSLDTTDLTPEPATPLKLLLEGSYHKSEVWRGAEKQAWLGLYHEKGTYILRPTSLQVHTVEDPIADNEGIISGRAVTAADSNGLFYITGLPASKAGSVDTAVFSQTTLAANKVLAYSYKGKEYYIKAYGDSVQTATGQYRYTLYGWKVAGTKNGRNVEQTLAEDEAFDDSIYVLLWAGDLDRDGVPDLLLDLSNHYNLSRYVLYLSSMAERGKLYKKAAVFEVVGC